jgi:hypothetical protein
VVVIERKLTVNATDFAFIVGYADILHVIVGRRLTIEAELTRKGLFLGRKRTVLGIVR